MRRNELCLPFEGMLLCILSKVQSRNEEYILHCPLYRIRSLGVVAVVAKNILSEHPHIVKIRRAPSPPHMRCSYLLYMNAMLESVFNNSPLLQHVVVPHTLAILGECKWISSHRPSESNLRALL